MYGPYSSANYTPPQAYAQQTLRHPQPQHQAYPLLTNQPPPSSYDPAATLAGQFAKSGLESSNQYLKQNFGGFFAASADLHYYFSVSNSYVWRKLLLILFPYRNRNWTRIQGSENAYAPPSQDINAPDLYIPLMAFMTYILLWAALQGLKKQFHPQVFGVLASQTLAFSILDILVFRVGLYLLSCLSESSVWDLVSFSTYKYVPIIFILCWKHFFGHRRVVYWPIVLFLVANLAVFLMRSLKFMVLPTGVTLSSNSITSGQRRMRVQFLFVYLVVIQGLIIVYMSL